MTEEARAKLAQLLDLLRTEGDEFCARAVEDAIGGSDDELHQFLRSNELWGGAGSIADQALIAWTGRRTEVRRKCEALLADLGELQMAAGVVNARTAMWTSTFRAWQRKGI